MKTFIKKYKFSLIFLIVLIIYSSFNIEFGKSIAIMTETQLKEMLLVIPPIFVLLGLLDIWVPKETMVKYMGDNSGLKGVILSIILGSAAAGPLYGAFPVAAVFMKKGVKFRNILIFIGAWSTTKIPMLLFEISALGYKFALTRLLIDIPGVIIIAHILSLFISKDEEKAIYEMNEQN